MGILSLRHRHPGIRSPGHRHSIGPPPTARQRRQYIQQPGFRSWRRRSHQRERGSGSRSVEQADPRRRRSRPIRNQRVGLGPVQCQREFRHQVCKRGKSDHPVSEGERWHQSALAITRWQDCRRRHGDRQWRRSGQSGGRALSRPVAPGQSAPPTPRTRQHDLPEEWNDDAISLHQSCGHPLLAHREFGDLAGHAVDFGQAAVLLGDRDAEASTLADRPGSILNTLTLPGIRRGP